MKIAIVEDEKQDVDLLKNCIERYCREKGQELSIRCFIQGEDFLVDWPEPYDILFLDIMMNGIDGLDLAKKIREKDGLLPIVFVTNTPDYSLAGYGVDAVDYIIKPINPKRLEILMERIDRRRVNMRSGFIHFRNKSGYHVINVNDILYIELNGRTITLHTRKENLSYSGALRALEQALPPCFFRCHSSFIVNMQAVSDLKSRMVMVGNEALPVSKHRHRDFSLAFSRFLESVL